MKISRDYLFVLLGIAILVILVLIFSGRLLFQSRQKDDLDSVKVEQGSDTAYVYTNGKVILRSSSLSDETTWDNEKTNTFFKFIEDKVKEGEFVEGVEKVEDGGYLITYTKNGVTYTIILDDDEEEEKLISYFDSGETSTPYPTQNPGEGGGKSGGGSSSGGSSGGGFGSPSPSGPDPDCPFWRLSYCVYPRTPTPALTPSGTINPYPNLVYDCGLGGDTVTQRTVISNTLCVKEPTPSP